MGTEALWIPAVLSLVSAGSNYIDARNQRRKSDNIALDSMRQNSERQKRADAVNSQLAADIGKSTNVAEKGKRLTDYMAQLQGGRGDAMSGVGQIAGASSAYAADAAKAALGIEGYGQDYAGLMSTLDSAGDQRRREGRSMTDAATNIGLIGREQEGADRVTQLRLKGVRSNPWLQALSAVAQGAAMASAGGAFGGGSAASGMSIADGSAGSLGGMIGSPWGGNQMLKAPWGGV